MEQIIPNEKVKISDLIIFIKKTMDNNNDNNDNGNDECTFL